MVGSTGGNMAKRTPAELKAAAASLLIDSGADGSIQPSEHRAIVDDIADSLGVTDAVLTAGQVTLTLADGDTVVFTVATVRPTGAQYHALITDTFRRPQ